MARHKALIERGKEAIDRGNYAEAVGSLSQVVEENPGFADARYHLGLALHFTGHSPEAIEQFRQALVINPRYTEAHLSRALVLNDLGRLEEARAAFQEATASEESGDGLGRSARFWLANLHAELGDLYVKHGRQGEACDEYRKALGLAPTFDDVRTRLARCYLESGKATLAASEFGKVLVRKPGDLPARLGLGLVHFRVGERERARVLWEECRRLEPDDSTAGVYLGML